MLYVVYHGGCTDGFAAAWVAHLVTDDATILPEYHKEWKTTKSLLEKVTKEDQLIFFDICPPRAMLLALNEKTNVEVHDHHLSAEKDCGDLPFVHIDQTRSGVTLAWEYYCPKLLKPFFIELIEDNDLYKHEIPDCKAYIEFIYMLKKDFEVYTLIAKILQTPDGRDEILEKGRSYLEHTEYLASKAANKHNVLISDVFEERVLFANSCFFQNEIVNDNLLNCAKAGGVFYLSDIGWKVSLRSNPKHNVDVSKFAEKFGGGGHKYSSAFIVEDLSKLKLRALTQEELVEYGLVDDGG